MRVCVCVYVCMCMYMCTCVYVHVGLCMYVCVNVIQHSGHAVPELRHSSEGATNFTREVVCVDRMVNWSIR